MTSRVPRVHQVVVPGSKPGPFAATGFDTLAGHQFCHNVACDYVGELVDDAPRGYLCPRCASAVAVARGLADYVDLHAGVGWPLDNPAYRS